MRVWGLWHGGHSYAVGSYQDIELFNSLEHAKRIFNWRRMNVDGTTPCVGETESMWVWFKNKPADNGDLYPDAIIESGPRGGIRCNPC